MLVVLTTISSTAVVFVYIGIFGIGSIGGMLVMTTAISLPFKYASSRFRNAASVIRGMAGASSVVFGLFLAWQIGIAEGLFV
jgi:high-affinity nickel-transport protein